ncbi:MAG TPA: ABC transporter substrate-binding protein [Devosiaceae bacterium]|nr:ABC transporter substrate-binding protein [Devosiaceae bacterium]
MLRRTLLALSLGASLAAVTAFAPAMAAPRSDLNIGMVLEPPNLDPTTGGAAAPIREVTYANIFEGLTRIDSRGGVQPALAKSWDISPDGLTYMFHLQTGVKFHDGTPFSADDVKFSLDRARDPKSTNAQKQLFAAIKSVNVIDPATVKITLSQPDGDFLYNMGWGDAVIVSPKSAATNVTNPIGTGPFKFVDWVKGDHVDLARNPDYWGTPVKLDKVTFKFISDPSAATAAILAGDIDAFPLFPAPEALDQIKSDPRFDVVVGNTEGETILAMNNARKPLNDLRVRQAIAHAIDRKTLLDGTMFGYGTPIGTFFPPDNPAYVDLTGESKFDPDRSRQLLKEAGVSNLTLSLKLPPPPYARNGGQIIAQQLANVGITANITNVEWADWLQNVFTDKDYDLTIVSHVEPNDIGIFARDTYYFNYHSDAFKKIMADLNATTDPAQRKQLQQQAQKQLTADMPVAFLFELPDITVQNKSLKGLWANAPIPADDLTQVYWAQ